MKRELLRYGQMYILPNDDQPLVLSSSTDVKAVEEASKRYALLRMR